jgi:rubrerythrin
MLRPVHRWIWRDAERRAHKLLRFAETEADGGRDLVRAAEVTSDPLLRRLYLVHAADEHRHADLFRQRGMALLAELHSRTTAGFQAHWLAPSEHGLDDLQVDREPDDALLAFLHLSERAAAQDFEVYRDVLQHDPQTRAIFDDILRDESFHMTYTISQLARVSPAGHRKRLWRARISRLWKAYLRIAAAIAGVMGAFILTIQYFIVLPPFVWFAKRSARREPQGWRPIPPGRNDSLKKQY